MRATLTYLMLCLCFTVTGFLHSQENSANNNDIQRVRIDVETPLGYIRHLLIGFTPDNAATDGFDYGYDAPNIENYPDDASWLIDGDPYVTQGVGAFDDMKKYPIGLFLSNDGTIKFSLLALENFDDPIGVYIYDDLLDQYVKINESALEVSLAPDIYNTRYYLAFKDHNAAEGNLGISDAEMSKPKVSYSPTESILNISTNSAQMLKGFKLFDMAGRLILSKSQDPQPTISEQVELDRSQVFVLQIFTRKNSFIKKIVVN